MALSLGSGRRRRPCRAVHKGGSGCRHFHVHYHFPRQVCAFSSLRFLFSMLPYLLIPPVLFFAVLAFLVCFGWFTLVYFVSSLLRKCTSPECLEVNRDANELCRNEEQARNKEITGGCVADGTGSSAVAEACIEGQQIKEVFVDGLSDASLDMSMMASPYDCTKDEEHYSCEKLVEEVTIFEANCKECNGISYFDVSSEKEQMQDTPADCLVEEINNRELCTSYVTTNLVQPGQEFVTSPNEAPAYAKSEILELIDKHETRALLVKICSDNSTENYVKCGADLPDDISAKKLPEDFFDEQQGTQTTVTDHTNKLCEDHSTEGKEKLTFCIKDETHERNNESEMSGSRLPLDPVSENKYSTVATSNAYSHHSSDEEDGHEKIIAENNRSEASGTTSLVCDLAENNQAAREEIGAPSTEDNIHEVASGESSVIGKTEEEEDENSCTSEGGLRRLPLIRRSQPPWWNLCGVLDVFAGCDKD